MLTLRSLFCFAQILVDQALSSLLSFLPSYWPTYLPTSYLHPTYMHWALCQRREKAEITRYSRVTHSRDSQSIFSSFVHLTFQFSAVLDSNILTRRSMCFASSQSFWDETFSEPLSLPLEVSPGSQEFSLRFEKWRNLFPVCLQDNWCSFLIVNILILAICSDL